VALGVGYSPEGRVDSGPWGNFHGPISFWDPLEFRKRVVAAVVSGGLSCNQAAKPFGIGISTAIGWVNRLRTTGSLAPGQMGGHKPKAISGEHRVWLLQRTKDSDFTLRGLVGELGERGLRVDYRSVWSSSTPRSSASKKSVVAGERDCPKVARRRAQWIKHQKTSILNALSSSTRPGPEPIWPHPPRAPLDRTSRRTEPPEC